MITGASGFIGSRLCRLLRERFPELEIRALNRSTTDGLWDRVWCADIGAEEPLPPEAFDGVDVVFHLASKAHALADGPEDVADYQHIIVDGTTRVLTAARQAGVKHLVYLSSVKAMGEGNPPDQPLRPLTVDDPPNPVTPYGKAKLAAEKLVLNAGLPHACVLRPVAVHGPGDKGNLERMRHAIQKGRFPPLPETGNRRSMVHVDHLAQACIDALDPARNGKVIIVADQPALSTRQLAEQLFAECGKQHPRWHIPLWTLKLLAKTGDLAAKILRKRMPFDSEQLEKLVGSAWYEGGGG